jgi:hypothetical protein
VLVHLGDAKRDLRKPVAVKVELFHLDKEVDLSRKVRQLIVAVCVCGGGGGQWQFIAQCPSTGPSVRPSMGDLPTGRSFGRNSSPAAAEQASGSAGYS